MRVLAVPRPLALPRPPVPSRRTVVTAVVAVAILVPGGLWLRDAPFVRAQHVKVTGVSGAQAVEVRQALVDAARGMSTLHPSASKLQGAVASFPIVRDVEVHGHLPDTLDVVVHQHVPVAALALGANRVAVAADGTLLGDSSPVGLPLVPVRSEPGGRRLSERAALRLVALLGAAPAPLRAHVARAWTGPKGLTAQLARGPELIFGPAQRLDAKWVAVARVLADPSSKGAHYLDVRVPERPAAGGLEPINPQPDVQPVP